MQTIIWDIGNVLLKLHFTRAHKFFMTQSGLPLEQYKNLSVLQEKSIRALETGQVSSTEFFSLFQRQTGINLSEKEFRQRWNQIFSENEYVMSVAEAMLKQNIFSLVLSNTNEMHWQFIRGHYPIFARFDGVVTSYEAGSMKPDQALYLHTIKKYSLDPAKALFVDDRLENVQGAKQAGLRAFHYTFNDSELANLLRQSFAGLCIPESYAPE